MSDNPYLNVAPTELKREIGKQKDPRKKKLMQRAIDAWRTVVPSPFRKQADDILKIVRELEGSGNEF